MKVFGVAFVLSTLIVWTYQTVVKEDFVCVKGTTYKENDCNNCLCNEGRLSCSRKSCSVGTPSCMIRNEDDTVTTVDNGNAWNVDCNRCWCTRAYGKVCTVKKC
ncbi:hypothetical protein ILUMI_18178 [Ignelater luminosus]|uniref:Protease inhibitor n=1 Tax=Ignelater luminosus TaxID=2038154 RepID=A0A8K0CN30_IGNLU|nr:hypothetical protein ILUMI_18178 [Ignelater luminosus]